MKIATIIFVLGTWLVILVGVLIGDYEMVSGGFFIRFIVEFIFLKSHYMLSVINIMDFIIFSHYAMILDRLFSHILIVLLTLTVTFGTIEPSTLPWL